jgi:hypothetical protein
MSCTERVEPYHGHMTKSCEEKAMKEMRRDTKPTNRRPSSLPIEKTRRTGVLVILYW